MGVVHGRGIDEEVSGGRRIDELPADAEVLERETREAPRRFIALDDAGFGEGTIDGDIAQRDVGDVAKRLAA